MDCSEFENLLERLCDGSAGGERSAAERHARSCRGCAGLLRLARGEEGIGAPAPDAGFARSVLDATTGPACERAREKLSETVDGPLDPRVARMLDLHLGHCPDCLAFASAMQMLRQILPAAAEIDPGPAFAPAVLQAVRASRPAAPRRRFLLRPFWERLVRRPLFAWEAAYAGTVLFALVFLNPLLPVRDASVRALASVQSRAASVVETAPAEIGSVGGSIRKVSFRATGALQATSVSVAHRVNRSILEPVRSGIKRTKR